MTFDELEWKVASASGRYDFSAAGAALVACLRAAHAAAQAGDEDYDPEAGEDYLARLGRTFYRDLIEVTEKKLAE